MPKTKQDSPRNEFGFGGEFGFGEKKKRQILQRYKFGGRVKSVKPDPLVLSPQGIVELAAPRKKTGKRPRPIRDLGEALTMSYKNLYLRAHAAETEAERQQYKAWARARVRWEIEAGIRKPKAKKSVAA